MANTPETVVASLVATLDGVVEVVGRLDAKVDSIFESVEDIKKSNAEEIGTKDSLNASCDAAAEHAIITYTCGLLDVPNAEARGTDRSKWTSFIVDFIRGTQEMDEAEAAQLLVDETVTNWAIKIATFYSNKRGNMELTLHAFLDQQVVQGLITAEGVSELDSSSDVVGLAFLDIRANWRYLQRYRIQLDDSPSTEQREFLFKRIQRWATLRAAVIDLTGADDDTDQNLPPAFDYGLHGNEPVQQDQLIPGAAPLLQQVQQGSAPLLQQVQGAPPDETSNVAARTSPFERNCGVSTAVGMFGIKVNPANFKSKPKAGKAKGKAKGAKAKGSKAKGSGKKDPILQAKIGIAQTFRAQGYTGNNAALNKLVNQEYRRQCGFYD